MVRYGIREKLTELSGEAFEQESLCRLAVMTPEEFKTAPIEYTHRKLLLRYLENVQYCKAEVFGKCIIGTLLVPEKKNLLGKKVSMGYYMTAEQLILLTEDGTFPGILEKMKAAEFGTHTEVAWLFSVLLDCLIHGDVLYLQNMEKHLSGIEEELIESIPKNFYKTVIHYRKELLVLHSYYEQLEDLGQELGANTDSIFEEANRVYFQNFEGRAERLHNHVEMLREYVLQIREMYQTQIDIEQNKTMNVLTVVTTIFLPLSLLVGWYGMNFINMPELQWEYGYIFMIVLSAGIIALEFWYFKKKGLL